MNFYENKILPRFIDTVCGHKAFAPHRKKIVSQASGRVLEVGYGTGTNLPWYDETKVKSLQALDPAAGAFALAAKRERQSPINVEHIALRGEEIPLDAESIDTVVVAYTLCTIPDVMTALQGMHRVLVPGGKLLFLEHGESPKPHIQRWQKRLNGVWQVLFGGCNLVRKPTALLSETGFILDAHESFDVSSPPCVPGISLVRYNYLGLARRM